LKVFGLTPGALDDYTRVFSGVVYRLARQTDRELPQGSDRPHSLAFKYWLITATLHGVVRNVGQGKQQFNLHQASMRRTTATSMYKPTIPGIEVDATEASLPLPASAGDSVSGRYLTERARA